MRLPLAFVVSDSGYVRIALIGSVMLLLIVELLNTAIEKLCDHLSPALSNQIKVVKDLGSAAVFVALVLAAAVWLLALWRLLLALTSGRAGCCRRSDGRRRGLRVARPPSPARQTA